MLDKVIGAGVDDKKFSLDRAGNAHVTSVHMLQIVDDEIPMTEHDIPLTAIVTPAEIIDIKPRFNRPKGIYWEMLHDEKVQAIPVLKTRKGN